MAFFRLFVSIFAWIFVLELHGYKVILAKTNEIRMKLPLKNIHTCFGEKYKIWTPGPWTPSMKYGPGPWTGSMGSYGPPIFPTPKNTIENNKKIKEVN